jgi:hypothetical protein
LACEKQEDFAKWITQHIIRPKWLKQLEDTYVGKFFQWTQDSPITNKLCNVMTEDPEEKFLEKDLLAFHI